MEAKTYLDLSQKPEIRIIGLQGKTQIIKRPSLKNLERVSKGKWGKAQFVDRCKFGITDNITVDRLELWYDGQLMATRKLPDVSLFGGDYLVVNWVLDVSRKLSAIDVII